MTDHPESLADDLARFGRFAMPRPGRGDSSRAPPVPDPALLDAYEMIDHEWAAWWRDRLARIRAEFDCSGNVG